MADVHIPGFGQFRQPVLMTPVTLHPSSRTIARAAGSVTQSGAVKPSRSRRTASPANTPMGTQPQPAVQEGRELTSVSQKHGTPQPVSVSLPQPHLVVESTAAEGGDSHGGAQEQVRLEVIGTDAVVTIADTLLDDVVDQGADLSMPEAKHQVPAAAQISSASQASEYLRR